MPETTARRPRPGVPSVSRSSLVMLAWLGALTLTGGCIDGMEPFTGPTGLDDDRPQDPWVNDYGVCGDGLVDPDEDCDDEDFAGLTCADMGLGQGTLACTSGCTIDTRGCSEPPTALPTAPSLQVTASPIKRMNFDWTAVDEAEHYQLLERLAESEPYTQIGGDLEGESTSIEAPLHLRTRASYVLRACNDHGCTDSDPVRPPASMIDGVGYFKASNTDHADDYGAVVVLSADGNTMAVAAMKEDGGATRINGDQADESSPDSGAVYVYTRDDAGAWSPRAYVKASNADAEDHFGSSLALSADGRILAVGASRESGGATGIDGDPSDDSRPNSGAVYVFTQDDADAWSQEAYIKGWDVANGDRFGGSVALSDDGSILAVGAYREDGLLDGEPLLDSGAVHTYTRDATGTWSEQAYITATNASPDDRFGRSVAFSGDGTALVVGAMLEDGSATVVDGESDDASLDSGAAYLYRRGETGEWLQEAYLKASNAAAGDQFGESLALSEDGTTLAIGARHGDTPSSSDSGAVYLYARHEDGRWFERAHLDASNAERLDRFGRSVALSRDGNILAVGADGEAGADLGLGDDLANDSAPESGAVYLFTRDDAGPWSQRAYVKAPNADSGDMFGWSVSLSGDGSSLAVGAPKEQSTATNIGGPQDDDGFGQAGAVYLY